MEDASLLLALALAFGLFMAWGIGANDVANAMGTSVGSRALSLRQAVIIAAIFEFSGAVLAGGQVTATIRKGIVDTALVTGTPELLVYGMLASLLAAGTWLLIASYFGWPVSTTHSIVGAIVGFASVGIGLHSVQWGKVGTIVMSWVISPVTAGFISYALFRSVQILILDAPDPLRRARRYVPCYIFMVGFVIALVTLLKGLSHVGIPIGFAESCALAALVGLVSMGIGMVRIARVRVQAGADREFHFASVERVFGVLMVFTACAMAFAHGSNDVANAVGPVAAVVSIVNAGGNVLKDSPLPVWVLLVGAAGIVAGLAMYGKRVMMTVGSRITDLTPSHGFAATLGADARSLIAEVNREGPIALASLEPGDLVDVVGRIADATTTTLWLEDCRVEGRQ